LGWIALLKNANTSVLTLLANSCDVGYTGPDGGRCTACLAGLYKDSNGSIPCADCPPFSTSPLASSDVLQCICDLGYTGNGMSCTACAHGTFKSVNGSSNCTACPRGKYSTASNATSYNTCLACPIGSYSPEGSQHVMACECNFGFTGPNGGNCSHCEPGKFKNINGSAPCSSCPRGTYSSEYGEISQATCTACPTNSFSHSAAAPNITSCICNIGFSGPNGGTCLACEPAFFKDTNGSSFCRPCAVGSFQGSTNASACASCEPGYYSVGRQSVCTLCPTHSFSPASSNKTNCTCNGEPAALYSPKHLDVSHELFIHIEP